MALMTAYLVYGFVTLGSTLLSGGVGCGVFFAIRAWLRKELLNARD